MQNQSALKVVSISSPRSGGSGAYTLTQRDFAEEIQLGRELEAAAAKHAAKLAWIEQALENGATIEPGPLTATMKTRRLLVLHRSKPV